jgi:hypothetical protein
LSIELLQKHVCKNCNGHFVQIDDRWELVPATCPLHAAHEIECPQCTKIIKEGHMMGRELANRFIDGYVHGKKKLGEEASRDAIDDIIGILFGGKKRG